MVEENKAITNNKNDTYANWLMEKTKSFFSWGPYKLSFPGTDMETTKKVAETAVTIVKYEAYRKIVFDYAINPTIKYSIKAIDYVSEGDAPSTAYKKKVIHRAEFDIKQGIATQIALEQGMNVVKLRKYYTGDRSSVDWHDLSQKEQDVTIKARKQFEKQFLYNNKGEKQ